MLGSPSILIIAVTETKDQVPIPCFTGTVPIIDCLINHVVFVRKRGREDDVDKRDTDREVGRGEEKERERDERERDMST